MTDGLNKVMLLGQLGADPELRFTQSGQPVLNIRMATSESYLDKDKARQVRTEWHNVTVWGKRAEALAKLLVKGSQIYVGGSLRTSSYDDRDGNKRYKTEVVAQDVILAGGKRADNAEPERREQQPRGAGRGAPPPQDDPNDGGFGDGYGSSDDIPF